MTSKTPPTVSLAFRTRSISFTIEAEAWASKHRTGEASTSSRSSGPGGPASSGTATVPIRTTWESTRMPSSARNALHGHPAATRAAVSLALARSKTFRTSSNPYFMTPARSAWPGRGRVSLSPGSVSPSTAIRSRYFSSHSAFSIVMAMGLPRVRPCRTPDRISNRSPSSFCRPLRPYPWRRRASSPATSFGAMGTPAGNPSRTATRALPCDSPAVSSRNMHLMIGECGGRPRFPGTALEPATAPPVRGPPKLYFCGLVQSVNPSSPKTKRAQFPLIETSLKFPSKVSPTDTVNTLPSTSTWTLVPPWKMSMSTTVWPPTVVLCPPPGVVGVGVGVPVPVGGGMVPVPVGGGLTLPLGGGDPVCKAGGMENGSRDPARTTGGSVSRGVAVGLTVGVGVGPPVEIGGGAASSPPPPPSTFRKTKASSAAPATAPNRIRARRSRGERAIVLSSLARPGRGAGPSARVGRVELHAQLHAEGVHRRAGWRGSSGGDRDADHLCGPRKRLQPEQELVQCEVAAGHGDRGRDARERPRGIELGGPRRHGEEVHGRAVGRRRQQPDERGEVRRRRHLVAQLRDLGLHLRGVRLSLLQAGELSAEGRLLGLRRRDVLLRLAHLVHLGEHQEEDGQHRDHGDDDARDDRSSPAHVSPFPRLVAASTDRSSPLLKV